MAALINQPACHTQATDIRLANESYRSDSSVKVPRRHLSHAPRRHTRRQNDIDSRQRAYRTRRRSVETMLISRWAYSWRAVSGWWRWEIKCGILAPRRHGQNYGVPQQHCDNDRGLNSCLSRRRHAGVVGVSVYIYLPLQLRREQHRRHGADGSTPPPTDAHRRMTGAGAAPLVHTALSLVLGVCPPDG